MPVGFSKVQVFNMALSHVGSSSTLEDEGERSAPANACRLWYDASRLVTLEAYNWSFARKRLPLALHEQPAPFGWNYRYQYPSDCVACRLIENPLGRDADAVPFDVEMGDDESKSIVTDMEKAVLIYTRNLDRISLFSMHFVMMLSVQLGILINAEITGKARIANKLQGQFDILALQAPEHDADSSVPEKERDAPWIRARA